MHAKHAICCPECHKQYVAYTPNNFLTHFKNAHPNARMPFNFDEASSSTVKKEVEQNDTGSDDSDSSESNASDDKITLYGCGVTTYWRVPLDQKKCPVLTCRQEFKMRSNFISHYKKNHAKGSILCTACVPPKPIRVSGPVDFRGHFGRLHPNQALPYGLDQTEERSKKVVHLKSKVRNSSLNFLFFATFKLISIQTLFIRPTRVQQAQVSQR